MYDLPIIFQCSSKPSAVYSSFSSWGKSFSNSNICCWNLLISSSFLINNEGIWFKAFSLKLNQQIILSEWASSDKMSVNITNNICSIFTSSVFFCYIYILCKQKTLSPFLQRRKKKSNKFLYSFAFSWTMKNSIDCSLISFLVRDQTLNRKEKFLPNNLLLFTNCAIHRMKKRMYRRNKKWNIFFLSSLKYRFFWGAASVSWCIEQQ
jgi:hypothetical protein